MSHTVVLSICGVCYVAGGNAKHIASVSNLAIQAVRRSNACTAPYLLIVVQF